MKTLREPGPFSYPLIGQGSRRCCYQLPGQPLCVKFYRDPRELSPQTRPSVRWEITTGRFFRARNVNFHEWQYHCSLRKRLPAELLSVFPEHVELAYSETKGWGIVESLITNPDGTPAKPLHTELAAIADPALRLRIYRETKRLLDQMVEQGVKLYDMPNLLLQWTNDQTFRLRIADFEPCGRGAWGWTTCCKPLVRCKVRRRGKRYLARLRQLVPLADPPDLAANGTGGRFALRFAHMAGLI